MNTVERREQELYGAVWESIDAYDNNSPGVAYNKIFREIVQGSGSVLDAGCGAGRAGLLLQDFGYRVQWCDFVSEGLNAKVPLKSFTKVALWNDLQRQIGFVDYVYCCDVLEHIPTELTMLALYQMMRIARRGLFLTVSTVPDNFGQWVGEPLHKTVQPFTWWRDRLRMLGTTVEARDMLISALFYVEPLHAER
jgi:2-polyprenyl-3-methyl-5-hydroxy-6-metoxy-1,4-benzoquinol methylase